MRDAENQRWPDDAEVYRAINLCLLTWKEQVRLPQIYTIPDGWQFSDYDYALPNYVRPPLRPQLKRNIPYHEYTLLISPTSTWQDLVGWDIESDGSGGLILRVSAAPRNLDGRILYWVPNSRVPLTLPTTNAELSSSGTSVTMGSAVDVDDTGWVKIGAEWMSYAGITRSASTTTLNNLVRGLYGTTAATQASGSTVTWGIAADDMGLYKQLYDQVRAYLHEYFLVDGSVHETNRHEKMMGYYQGMADTFWQKYTPSRPSPKLIFGRRAVILR
jgi:hypothetical protein